jgi:hypothetical protein
MKLKTQIPKDHIKDQEYRSRTQLHQRSRTQIRTQISKDQEYKHPKIKNIDKPEIKNTNIKNKR